MKKQTLNVILNPFIRIAGMKALTWGALGLMASTFLSWASGYHYHGLLHFGPAPNPAWWCYLTEHLIVWLVPSMLFYLGGIIFSHSKIRLVDVLGTVLFAQIPMIVMNLIYCLPPMRVLEQITPETAPAQLLSTPDFHIAILLSMVCLPFLIITLIWMVLALKVSCNLKKAGLWIVGFVGIIGGDIICRWLIGQLY